MAWVKLDDHFPDHPKILAAGPIASWLYICGLSYCGRLLTDGFIPAGQVRKLADVDDAGAAAERLVEVGLWERADGGYRVHDYLDYQLSRERVLRTREVRAEAGARGGRQKASNLLEVSQTFASENLKQNPTPLRSRLDPVPVEIPATAPRARARETEPPPPLPPQTIKPAMNGRAVECAFAAAVGDGAFATIAGNFAAVNVQLDAAWLRTTIGRYEAAGLSLPPPAMKSALKRAYLKTQDALGREGNRIQNPPAWAAKQIEAALREAGREARGP